MQPPGTTALTLATLALLAQALAPPTVLAPTDPQGRGRRRKTPEVELTPFVGELAQARAHAGERNAPLLIHLILEGEAQNDQYRDTLLPDRELRAASVDAVVLIANNGEHEPKTVFEEIEGRRVESTVCSKYPWFRTCGEHRLPWQSLYEALREENGDLGCPQSVLYLPDGKQHWRKNDRNPPSKKELLAALKKAVAAAGPALDEEQLATVRRLRGEARRSMEGSLLGAAWAEWTAVLTLARGGTHHAEATRSREEVERLMAARLEDLGGQLKPGQAAAAYAELYTAQADWGEAPAAAQARKLMKKAEKDKAIAGEIADWKREQEARELLDAARAATREDRASDLRKSLRKLFSKKYANTAAAEAARQEFPEHAPTEGEG